MQFLQGLLVAFDYLDLMHPVVESVADVGTELHREKPGNAEFVEGRQRVQLSAIARILNRDRTQIVAGGEFVVSPNAHLDRVGQGAVKIEYQERLGSSGRHILREAHFP